MKTLPDPIPRIDKADLHPGDVLLSRGPDALSDFVANLDGGIYSHAALWYDENGDKGVVEVTRTGVHIRSLADIEEEQPYIDVYRFTKKDGAVTHELGPEPYEAKPVLSAAHAIVTEGGQYAYDQLLMGALVIWTSKRPKQLWLRIAARIVLALIERWILEQIVQKEKKGMVCTQVVCSSFWDADPADRRYGIGIRIDGSRSLPVPATLTAAMPPGLPSGPSDAYERVVQIRSGALFQKAIGSSSQPKQALALHDAHVKEAQAKRDNALEARSVAGAALETGKPVKSGGLVAPAGGPLVPLGCVTPREVQQSPDLEFKGRLHQHRMPLHPPLAVMLLILLLKLLWKKLLGWLKLRRSGR